MPRGAVCSIQFTRRSRNFRFLNNNNKKNINYFHHLLGVVDVFGPESRLRQKVSSVQKESIINDSSVRDSCRGFIKTAR